MGNSKPWRVLVSVSSRNPHYSEAWTSCQEVINIALQLIREKSLIAFDADDPRYQVLATERWNMRVYIVFDIFNELYDPDTAHLPGQNDISVISVFLHGSGSRMRVSQASR